MSELRCRCKTWVETAPLSWDAPLGREARVAAGPHDCTRPRRAARGAWGVLQDARASARRGSANPRNPRHFDTIEGGRVCQTRLVTIQSAKVIYSCKATVSDTCGRPGGV